MHAWQENQTMTVIMKAMENWMVMRWMNLSANLSTTLVIWHYYREVYAIWFVQLLCQCNMFRIQVNCDEYHTQRMTQLQLIGFLERVRKLEHRSHFSLIFSLWTFPSFLSLTTFPLHIPPNRPYSPLSLVFIAASSST